MNRMPAFTKNEIEPTTWGKRSSGTCPEARTSSSTSMALASANAISCTGVAPASCRWYEHTLMGFHAGAFALHHAIRSTVSRRLGWGGKMYVPRDRYSFMMSFCVVPRSSCGSTPCSPALAT